MKRDLRIDTIRGLLLVMMTVNHTHNALLYQGWIQVITVSPLGFLTSAEGFIFISGFVMGLIYSTFGQVSVLFRKILSRAKTIYLYHLMPLYALHLIAMMIPFLAISWEKNLSFYYLAKRTLVAEGLLLYQPEIFDILPMYVIFVLIAPFVLLTLRKRRGWIVVVLLSISLWGLGQQFDPLCVLNKTLFPGHRCGWFNVLVWQVLFVLGLVLGFHKKQLEEIKAFKNPIFGIGVFTAVLALFLLRHEIIDLGPFLAANILKKNLGWVRIVNLMVLVAFFGSLFQKLPHRAHIPGVIFIGQHSLQVFTFQVLLIYFITPFQEIIVAHLNGFTYPVFMLLVVASLLIPAYAHSQWRLKKQNQRTA